MKTLYLCRHAKSSWADLGMSDFDRPLNERGKRNAPHMAKVFKERGEPVDAIVSSPANRARTTAGFFAKALAIGPDRYAEDRAIYHAERSRLMQVVQGLPAAYDRVILFGHNPGFSDLLEYLSGDGPRTMPTCGMARIDFALDDWELIGKHTGTLVWFDFPKRYPGQE